MRNRDDKKEGVEKRRMKKKQGGEGRRKKIQLR